MECDVRTLQDIDRNVKSVLSRLGGYQLYNGSFAYWSGGSNSSDWGTAYAAHFLTEAAKYGYGIDRPMLDRALKYLRGNEADSFLTQAYAQYVLALNNMADRGAMNRLREKAADLKNDVKWMLAAAYALDGNRKVAEELTAQGGSGQTGKVDPYDDTYNSSERQMAVVLMTQTLLGKREEAFRTALKMSDILKKEKWLSTQSTAWMLSTLSNFIVSGTDRHRRHCGQGARQDRQIHREHAPGRTDRGEEQWFGQPLCGRQPELYPRQGRGNRSCERHPDRRALHEYGRCRHRPGLDPGIDRFLRHRDRL
ncbi:MAG: hypothetical protein ACLRM8_10035 [Alistipes sp.]